MQYFDYQTVRLLQKQRETEAKRYRMAQEAQEAKHGTRTPHR